MFRLQCSIRYLLFIFNLLLPGLYTSIEVIRETVALPTKSQAMMESPVLWKDNRCSLTKDG